MVRSYMHKRPHVGQRQVLLWDVCVSEYDQEIGYQLNWISSVKMFLTFHLLFETSFCSPFVLVHSTRQIKHIGKEFGERRPIAWQLHCSRNDYVRPSVRKCTVDFLSTLHHNGPHLDGCWPIGLWSGPFGLISLTIYMYFFK